MFMSVARSSLTRVDMCLCVYILLSLCFLLEYYIKERDRVCISTRSLLFRRVLTCEDLSTSALDNARDLQRILVGHKWMFRCTIDDLLTAGDRLVAQAGRMLVVRLLHCFGQRLFNRLSIGKDDVRWTPEIGRNANDT